jgi:hypothetical protein
MGDTVRKTFILKRGNYDAPGDEVQPGTPKAILPFPANYPKNRLGLAMWMFNKQNPLTARTFVNQQWQEFFGRGFVKSSGDFGMQGDLPKNLPLLDWLSVDFRSMAGILNGWLNRSYCQQLTGNQQLSVLKS